MNQLFEVLSNSDDGIAVIDEGGNILFWNKALEEITGINETYARTQKVWELQAILMPDVYRGDQKKSIKNVWFSKEIKTIANNKDQRRTEISLHRPNGTIILVEQHFYPFDKDGGTCFCAFIRDLTEIKKTEKTIEEINQVMRHDLRTPLNAIYGFSDPDLASDASPEDLQKFMKLIHEAAIRMTKIIDVSLLIGRIERGDKKLEKKNVGLLTLTGNVRKEFEPFGKSFGVNLKLAFDYEKITVSSFSQMEIAVEETLFQSLLVNLLRNAAEAAPPEKKEISLNISWRDGLISFTVHNFGDVPKEIRDRLFQKYATFGKRNGNGLGLYSAKLIATAHGGDIRYSTGGDETNFTVEIPI